MYFILMFLLLATNVYSAEVKINSFNTIRIEDSLNHPLAELCGTVKDAKLYPAFVKIISDPGSRNPGSYNALTDERGNFCAVIVTYRGRADVGIINDTKLNLVKINN